MSSQLSTDKLYQLLHTHILGNTVDVGINSIKEIVDEEKSCKMLTSELNMAIAHVDLQKLWLHAQDKVSHSSSTDG